MKIKLLLSCFLLGITIAVPIATNAQAVNVTDSLALVDLYKGTNGTAWVRNRNWLSGPVSEWAGITIINSRVARIELPYNNMTGSLPSSFGNLSGLQAVDMSVNNLNGVIPPSIGNLTNLASIDFFSNQLVGSLPISITSLTLLGYLEFSYNKLTGSIPASLGNLIHLKTLDLEVNQLSGSLPASIGNLKKLQDLYLGNNQFTGSIPTSICNLTRLSTLYLNNNMLTGSIPDSIGNLKQLQYLFLHNNQLTGAIPASVINLVNLRSLWLSYNQLSQPNNIGLPVTHQSDRWIGIDNNRFTFNSLESLALLFPYAEYSPQAAIPVHQNGNALSVSAGGILRHNTYQWFQVGVAGSNIIVGDSVYHPTSSGKYYAAITNLVATQLRLVTDTINYTEPFANEKQMKVTVYPNPVRNTLTISGISSNAANLIIADLNGQVWMHKAIGKEPIVQCDVSKLPPGNYVLQLGSGSSMQSVQFVKQE